jgi:hypothetical protein
MVWTPYLFLRGTLINIYFQAISNVTKTNFKKFSGDNFSLNIIKEVVDSPKQILKILTRGAAELYLKKYEILKFMRSF